MLDIKTTPEYREIEKLYGDRTAQRSGVKLMHHIDEGVAVIEAISTLIENEFDVFAAKRAYALHPLLQTSEMLEEHGTRLATCGIPALSILHAMEYRARANGWLSDKVDKGVLTGRPNAGPLMEVWAMLVADKVQNYKDFLIHHKGHARYDDLDLYFKTWFAELDIDPPLFSELCIVMSRV